MKWFIAAWACIIIAWVFSYATGSMAATGITPGKVMAIAGLVCAVIGIVRSIKVNKG